MSAPNPTMYYGSPLDTVLLSDKEIAAMTPPDLRTMEGQLTFLDYHAPTPEQKERHETVNEAVQNLWKRAACAIPDGPGKTRALHALNRARMEMNSAIANHGA